MQAILGPGKISLPLITAFLILILSSFKIEANEAYLLLGMGINIETMVITVHNSLHGGSNGAITLYNRPLFMNVSQARFHSML
jgi:hypothetical protein